jgi:hypothetical protein
MTRQFRAAQVGSCAKAFDVLHRFSESGRIEWIALVFLRRYFEQIEGCAWEDVHDDHAPAVRDIDLRVDGVSADLKADAYFADLDDGEAVTRYKKPRSGYLALETVSTDFSHRWPDDRRPDPSQSSQRMGWMHTSRADEIWYYFLTLDNPPDEIDALASAQTGDPGERERRLLDIARIHRDGLLILPAAPLKAWFWENLDRFDRRGARNPRYTTWFRRVPWRVLIAEGLVRRRVPHLALQVLARHRGGAGTSPP